MLEDVILHKRLLILCNSLFATLDIDALRGLLGQLATGKVVDGSVILHAWAGNAFHAGWCGLHIVQHLAVTLEVDEHGAVGVVCFIMCPCVCGY